MSVLRPETSVLRPETSVLRPETSVLRPETSALSCETSALSCETSALSSAMSFSMRSKRAGMPRNSLVSSARSNSRCASGLACSSAMMRATSDFGSKCCLAAMVATPAIETWFGKAEAYTIVANSQIWGWPPCRLRARRNGQWSGAPVPADCVRRRRNTTSGNSGTRTRIRTGRRRQGRSAIHSEMRRTVPSS